MEERSLLNTSIYTEETPYKVRNTKHQGLHLITESTPNGKKVQILLEDLREAYGLQFTTSLIDIDTDEQKQEWFLRLNHNGRIPIIIDNNISPPHPVMESTAELLYLVNRYDKDRLFSFADDMEQSELIQWIIFCQASGQPHQGQTIDFFRGAGKDNSYALQCFRGETLRVYSVLEDRLAGRFTGSPRDWLAGHGSGKSSAADIGAWPWVRSHRFCGITEEEMSRYPNLQNWILRIGARGAVQRALGDAYDNEAHPELVVLTQS